MSTGTVPTPAPAAPKRRSYLRTLFISLFGIGGGVFVSYGTAIFERVVKPLPVANFTASADGLTVTCQNLSTGNNGWWDFGDGSSLEPFNQDEPTIAHTYAKAGSYSVKLTVRNLTADENNRSVTVEAKATGKDAPPPPQIAGFEVKPVSSVSMAPATFRVTADVQNAEHLVFDLGDGRLEVAEGGGKIERMVTFEKPGSFPIQLVAFNGQSAVKQASAVKVETPPDNTLMAVITITDGGSQTTRDMRHETLAIPAPRDKTTTFSRNIWAKPGFTLSEVVTAKPDVPGVKNLKLAVAADKRSAAVSGEFANLTPGKVGADALIPLKITEERASSRPPSSMQASAILPLGPDRKASATIPLPALNPNADAVSRKIEVEVRQIGPNGKNFVVASGPLNGRGPVAIPAKNVYSPPNAAITTASYDIASVKVNFEFGSAAPTGRGY